MPKKEFEPKLSCLAVTSYKLPGSLLAKSMLIEIEDGEVVSVKDLTPAENIVNYVIGKAVKELWNIIRIQTSNTIWSKDENKED